jgi:hypothetical protein
LRSVAVRQWGRLTSLGTGAWPQRRREEAGTGLVKDALAVGTAAGPSGIARRSVSRPVLADTPEGGD